MPDPITNAQLAEWAALCEAATPGPWLHCSPGEVRADGVGPRLFGSPMIWQGVNGWQPAQTQVNLDFIAAARTAMPLLLAEVERLKAERADLRGALIAALDQPEYRFHEEPCARADCWAKLAHAALIRRLEGA